MAGIFFHIIKIGLEAQSSASAYPMVQVGDGKGNKDIVKKVDGRDHCV